MKTFICQHCGKENKWKGYSYNNKYCDNSCQHESQYKERINIWKETGKIGKGPLKRFLSEKKTGCYKCGITTWMSKPIVLELEHINGNSDDNSEENVSLLCPNCHSQTDTYKAKNKGNGRHNRMKRYYEGKSF